MLFNIKIMYIIISCCGYTYGYWYRWSSDERFDCVVGISYKGYPVSTGVFISSNIVLTSRNPIERYIKDVSDFRQHLKVTTVAQENITFYLHSRQRGVCWACSPFREEPYRDTSKAPFWVPIDVVGATPATEHSTGHDLYTLAVRPYDGGWYWGDWYYNRTFYLWNRTPTYITLYRVADIKRRIENYWYFIRRPFAAKVPNKVFKLESKHFMYGGFGNPSTRDSIPLHIEYYGNDHVLLDCDDYLLRTWGHFLCIKQRFSNPVISGAPLFNKGVLVGIGAFSMQYGEENILVFTDLRPYFNENRMETYNGFFSGMWIAFCGSFWPNRDLALHGKIRYQDRYYYDRYHDRYGNYYNDRYGNYLDVWDVPMTKYHTYMLQFRLVKRLSY